MRIPTSPFTRLFAVFLAFSILSGFAYSAPEDEAKAPAAAAAPAFKKKYRRSKLTYDETESVADHRRITLAAGEDKAVDLDFDANLDAKAISVGNPALVLPQLVKIGEQRQLIFKPLKQGETTVTLRDAQGNLKLIFTVIIQGSNLLRRASEIRDLLRDVEGVEIRVVGQKIVVDGQVLVPADYARVLQVVNNKVYAGDIMNLSALSPLALTILAKKIEESIRRFAPQVSARVVNGTIWLEGQVENNDMARRAFEVGKLYLPEAKPGNPLIASDPSAQVLPDRKMIQNFIMVLAPPPKKQEKLVRVTVHFVELSKNYIKSFGFKWQPAFTSDPTVTIGQTGSGGTGATGTSFSATLSSLIPKLANQQQAGYARVLKTGTVIMRSGQSGELNDTNEIPFLKQGPNGTAVGDKVTTGLQVNVTPQILGQSEDIQLDIDMEQSSLGTAQADGTPTTSRHKVKTKLYVKSNESAAIGAVNFSDTGTDFNTDDPASGVFSASAGGVQTSPLFTLLHSKKYKKKKSQFVIFVTPQIIEDASEGTEDLKKSFRVRVK